MYFFAVNRLFLFGDFGGRQNKVFELMTSANSDTRFHKIKNDYDADRMKLIFIYTCGTWSLRNLKLVAVACYCS